MVWSLALRAAYVRMVFGFMDNASLLIFELQIPWLAILLFHEKPIFPMCLLFFVSLSEIL